MTVRTSRCNRSVGIAFFIFGAALLRGLAQDDEIASTELNEQAKFVATFSAGVISWGGANSAALDAQKFPVNFGQVVDLSPLLIRLIYSTSDNRANVPNTSGLDLLPLTVGEAQEIIYTARTVQIACGEFHTLLLQRDGSVEARGLNKAGQCDVPRNLRKAIQVAAGSDHSLALRPDGSVIAWGWNDSGQASVPEGLPPAIAIDGGGRHSVALIRDGTVQAWGENHSGQSDVPAGLKEVVAVAAGGFHTLALTKSGTVVAWGDNLWGQTRVPADLKDAVAIDAGADFSMALLRSGEVITWGNPGSAVLKAPKADSKITTIAAGNYHALALTEAGTVMAWGRDDFGAANVPASLTNIVMVAAGGFHNSVIQQKDPLIRLRQDSEGLVLDLNLYAGQPYRIEASSDFTNWTVEQRGIARAGEMQWRPSRKLDAQFFRLGR